MQRALVHLMSCFPQIYTRYWSDCVQAGHCCCIEVPDTCQTLTKCHKIFNRLHARRHSLRRSVRCSPKNYQIACNRTLTALNCQISIRCCQVAYKRTLAALKCQLDHNVACPLPRIQPSSFCPAWGARCQTFYQILTRYLPLPLPDTEQTFTRLHARGNSLR